MIDGAGLLALDPTVLLKCGRLDLGLWLLSPQPGYLVSQFLNLLLLEPDNLQ
ncbi:hypothetical protein [Desulfomonile tiedjei]|uniref:hypothetical protein n=1 Tax=Desulfomonile tiedjei TaxID=2358 RepID=UPI0012F98B9B|nr:hypothetical protein [Desulfomonile tiedjei]